MGALALTSKAAYREPFEPLPGHVTFVEYGDEAALAEAVTDETAAVVLEPIQGEAGVHVAPDGYLAAARDITSQHGALLWLDEVQTGIGRTGAWFAHQLPFAGGVTPDVVTLAKGLGGGIPIGATIALGDAGEPARARQPRHHLRRQPGRLRGCARGAGHHRARRAARRTSSASASASPTRSPPSRWSPTCAGTA